MQGENKMAEFAFIQYTYETVSDIRLSSTAYAIEDLIGCFKDVGKKKEIYNVLNPQWNQVTNQKEAA